jgi:ATP-dependent helicase HrpB
VRREPAVTGADRSALIGRICRGACRAHELKDRPILPVLQGCLPPGQVAALDAQLPERLAMANGWRSRITYSREGPPALAPRIQELYGVSGKFTLAVGACRCASRCWPRTGAHPGDRRRAAFWRDMYPKVKAELACKYPRHDWRRESSVWVPP